MAEDSLLPWARRLAALAQTGIAYAQSPFDIHRYDEIRQIAAEMMSKESIHSPPSLVKLFKADRGYATPKVDVRGIVFRDDAILLVRETEDGRWTPPGGWVDVGEGPTEAVEKEIEQESGYTAKARKLIGVYNREQHGHTALPFAVFKLFILCDLTGGAAAASEETSEAGFFRRDEVPPLSLARVVPFQIERAFEHRLHPEWAADFD